MGAPQIKTSAREIRKHVQREMRRLKDPMSTNKAFVTLVVDETTGKTIGVAVNAEVARKNFGNVGETIDFELKVT